MVNLEGLFEGIYKDKKVLLTGHTGFKGSWLALWLQQMGAKVYGYALSNEDENNHIELLNLGIEEKIADIRDMDTLLGYFDKVQPDIVFHLAAQAIVRASYEDPIDTYSNKCNGYVKYIRSVSKNLISKSHCECDK